MSQNRPSPPPLQNVSWPLVLALGAVGLLLPIVHVTSLADAWGSAVTSILAIAVVTVVWVGVVVTRRVAEPLLTTMLAGLTFGVLATVLSGIDLPLAVAHQGVGALVVVATSRAAHSIGRRRSPGSLAA